MTYINLQKNLYWQLLRVAINAKHHLMKIADKHGLTIMQFYTLCLLEEDNSIPMSSLSSMLSCDASNITGIVDRLLSHDYIKREENPKDRREKIITLTVKGNRLCEKLAEALSLYQPASLSTLSDEEKQQLQALLAKVLKNPVNSTKQ